MHEKLIRAGIWSRRRLRFAYEGEHRTVEPYAFGYDKRNDSRLYGWQCSGARPGWRSYRVPNMR
jgi:hypothetical protein